MEGMEALHDRVNALLRRHSLVVRERDALKKELSELREEKEALRSMLRLSEEELLAARISQAIPDDAARAQSRKKLDAVIGEIDKILTSLND